VNTFGAIRSFCGSNNNPTVGQFVDALKTSVIYAVAIRGLCGPNCEDDCATVLDNLQSLLRVPDASSPNPSPSHGKETPDDVPESFHVSEQVQKYSGSIARQVLCGVSCDACKTCLTSAVLLTTNAFIHFKEYSDTEQSLTYPEKLVETAGTAVTLTKSVWQRCPT
jgi:hypothetical protein